MAGRKGVLIRIYGIVQGIGFRPYTAKKAKEYDIVGHVKNRGGFVEILAAPRAVENDSLRLFLHDLSHCNLPGAVVLHTQQEEVLVFSNTFEILESTPDENSSVMLPPDFAPCENCISELKDKKNRRYGHPFISCTSCGARYSIIDKVPYDRENTTLSDFPICENCSDEFYTLNDSRHCAQTICCNECGPELVYGELSSDSALKKAADTIKADGIIAVKGVSGYHLACSPFSEKALFRLRGGKKREHKPFAVMFPSLDVLKEYCKTTKETEEILLSSARPIVLLPPTDELFHPSVCAASPYIGAFLPSCPHHILLTEQTGPIVMTSANPTGLPIASEKEQLSSLPIGGVLDHNRKIITPLDDSVILPTTRGNTVIRRSRGYVPLPVYVKSRLPKTLAMGGDLKATFGLRSNDWCYLSQPLGDLEYLSNRNLYQDQISHMTKLFQINPERIVCDMHPSYFSSQIAQEYDLPVSKIQHHYSHILSVMGEHNITEPVIGVALDGVGYGTDGAIWGFEFLLCTRETFERVGHLEYTDMPASDEAMKNAKQSAMCHLNSCDLANSVLFDSKELEILRAAQKNNINTIKTSSAGRLFDAVSYILGCGDYNHFEGQCAQNLEYKASYSDACQVLELPLKAVGDGFVLAQKPLFEALLSSKSDSGALSYAFHFALAKAILDGCIYIRKAHGIKSVALGGGVFHNALLLELTYSLLEKSGFNIYKNEKFSPGDGSIALGQLSWEEKF